MRRASVSKCHHGTFSNSAFYLQVALSLHSPSSCFLLLYTLLPYSPHLIIPLYPLSLFLIPGDLPSANKQPPLHPHHAIYRHSKTSYFAVCGLYSSKRLSCCQGMSASLYLSHALSPAMFCLILMSRDWAMTYELT